jgi:dUTP pyrophosphatase
MNKKAYIKRFDKSLPLPEYKTSGAAGFDLCAREAMTIAPHAIGYVPLNVAIEPPEGYFVLLAGRSSLHKRGLMSINGVGIIDADYSGNDDEYIAVLYNFTNANVVMEKGDRIMQGVFLPLVQHDFEEVDEMENKTRGGFGTTGER